MGAYTRRDSNGVASDIELCFDYFPAPEGTRGAACRPAVGRRATDAGDQPSADGRPKLLLLDEPSLGLSPLLVQQIFGIIRRINHEQNVSILLVEQNAHIALQTADFGYVLEVGRIVAADTCAHVVQGRGRYVERLGVRSGDAGPPGQPGRDCAAATPAPAGNAVRARARTTAGTDAVAPHDPADRMQQRSTHD